MTRFFNLRRNLRTSIFVAFSTLLFLAFVLVGVVFNLAVNQYIRGRAYAELDEAKRDFHQHITESDVEPETLINNVPVSRYRGYGDHFFVLRRFGIDETYLPINSNWSATAYAIADVLYQEGIVISQFQNRRLRINEHTFFIATTGYRDEGSHVVFYLDVTDLQRFTSSLNVILLSLVGIIWLLAMLIATFLAGSLARPLHILSDFAQRIGRGDFRPNSISFANEEFDELNQNLNHTAKQLAKYDNDQKAFFQNASHELRTPLMSIKSYAEGIKYGIMEPEKASQTILEATDKLTGMVRDILYISKLDNLTVPAREQTDLQGLLEERIRLLRTQAESKGVEIHFKSSGPVIIACIREYLERAIDNIIANAIRYAETAVEVEYEINNTRICILRVMDDGPGFEPDVIPHVFERFYTGKNGLNGIGLSIVRSVADQHQGTVTAANGEKGAIVTLSIPYRLC